MTEQAPLLDTGNATLGTDVTNEYVKDIPLINRSMFGLVFLAGGVTESSGSGTRIRILPERTSFPTGSATRPRKYARWRVDERSGTGRGGNNECLLPAVCGNRSGIQGGEQQLLRRVREQRRHGGEHGAEVGDKQFPRQRWWSWQRSALDANNWFLNAAGRSPARSPRDQYGFSLGGPIEKERHSSSWTSRDCGKTTRSLLMAQCRPTQMRNNGDFSRSPSHILTPGRVLQPSGDPSCTRSQMKADASDGASVNGFPGNVDLLNNTQPGLIDPVGQALLKDYPEPKVGRQVTDARITFFMLFSSAHPDINLTSKWITSSDKISG